MKSPVSNLQLLSSSCLLPCPQNERRGRGADSPPRMFLLSPAALALLLTMMTPQSSFHRRGIFVVLEGLDRCGKTTQASLLLHRLQPDVVALRFPNRTTPVGVLIDQYLQSSSNLDDRSVHLLFSANRWEASDEICAVLASGRSVVCDRYAYSGVAFSAAKGVDGMSTEWCQAPDRGLPAPDCVVFLDVSQDEAEQRGGYGNERYEKRDFQLKVRSKFEELSRMEGGGDGPRRSSWHFVNAAQSVEQVHSEIWSAVQESLEKVQAGQQPLRKLWQEGTIDLSKYSDEKENRR